MLSPHEVLEIALRIENEGADFYRDLAESTDNENQGSVFRFLSSQERRHAETFRALLKRFEEEAAELVAADVNGGSRRTGYAVDVLRRGSGCGACVDTR